MTKIETFAEQHRLKVTRDECNDQIIQGRRGHLYFDGAELCLMVLAGKPAHRSKWKALGGKLWMGDISKNAQGARVQDVKITGIPLENARPAIQMCRIRQKRILNPEELTLPRGLIAKAREGLSKRPSSLAHYPRRLGDLRCARWQLPVLLRS
jgi:hypothetical protein